MSTSTTTTVRARRRVLGGLAAAAALTVALVGCTSSNDGLAQQYADGGTANYITGAGQVTEVPVADRTDPVEFTGTTDAGDEVSRSDYDGEVVVLNFWYASCPPCRAEAPDLQQLSETYADQGVQFLGVNVRDQAQTSLSFADTFGVTYPSVVDANDGAVQLALAGTIAPNSVPTTIVLDKQGRIAARILGGLDGPSILRQLVADAVAEQA
ncbi:thiol-disulfide isomerase/thioredoxin [Frigoribacterium sp. PhB160]|uniref:TlpA family protein disulfide reductase n=1 Tax=Frigoribacterium sp. PhB160 TaxID=2485192 RepID=UPI000F49AB7D|nr:TlpA disulfide reductase family protein [Frigoribacterium sp. PhB160]ROS61644.1 thiol-disulfide isomerase/thioredoxin [Frigoribacterium sp. PhB160]